MEKEIFEGLMDIFNSVNFRFLSHVEITRLLQLKGFYQSVGFHKAAADVWDHLNRPTANYPFCWLEKGNETLWGLERWLPPKKRRIAKRSNLIVSSLQVGWEIQHTISIAETEIINGTFPLRGQYADSVIASMDVKQLEHSIIELHCYGSEKLICAVTHDDRGNWFLEGMTLQRWYKENGLQAGDKIWLIVESINPLIMRAYTEWDRDTDTYRRYEQRRRIETLASTDLPIRDIIWIYFNRIQKIVHRREISKAVLKERPEISGRSVDACLGANPHLFSRVGDKGYWGLREWGVEQVNIVIQSKGSEFETTTSEHFPTAAVPIEYVLATIAGEDLVYKILRSSRDSLSVSQITEKIARFLGVDKSILARTTFFNSADRRLIRLQDGTFTLPENHEMVIEQLVINERELTLSLETFNKENLLLKNETELIMSMHNKLTEQLEEERGSAQELAKEDLDQHIVTISHREKLRQLIQSKLKLMFERLRQESEPYTIK